MRMPEHLAISAIVFGFNPWAMLGGTVVDLFFAPIGLIDFIRKKSGKPFKFFRSPLVQINWFFHSIWFLLILLVICIYFQKMIFWQAYFLHIVLDIPTHSKIKAIRIFYPISNYQLDLWKDYVDDEIGY